jgi:hypothetical protein
LTGASSANFCSAIVQAPGHGQLAENDLHIGIPVMRTAPLLSACGDHQRITSSPINRSCAMMHADLIDQHDLRERLLSLGVEVPAGASAEQACARALLGLDETRARALRSLIEQMLGSGASMLPCVREAISRQLLPALAEHQQSHA